MSCKNCQFVTSKGECTLPSYFKGIPQICENPKGDTFYQQIKTLIRENEIWQYLAEYHGCSYDNQTKNVLWNYVKENLHEPIDFLPIDIALAELSLYTLFGVEKEFTGVE